MIERIRAVGDTVAHGLDEIRDWVARQRKMSDVIAWISTPGRNGTLLDVVTQDEFTHDIAVSLAANTYLIYDVT